MERAKEGKIDGKGFLWFFGGVEMMGFFFFFSFVWSMKLRRNVWEGIVSINKWLNSSAVDSNVRMAKQSRKTAIFKQIIPIIHYRNYKTLNFQAEECQFTSKKEIISYDGLHKYHYNVANRLN